LIFRVRLERDLEDGGFVASCTDLPGCFSQGDTREEALENIRDAIVCFQASLWKHDPVPHIEEEMEIQVSG
jgi:predicted RNase H-like HicB family nuclease